MTTQNPLNKQETAKIGSLEASMRDIQKQSARLQAAILQAQADIDDFNGQDLLSVAKAHDPFAKYNAMKYPQLQRTTVLKQFVEEMTPYVDKILEEQCWYAAEIERINANAQKRHNDIELLEHQLTIDGDLPIEQRRLLLELKATATL
jgi:hypothetical protein